MIDRFRSQRGLAAVEMALILPVLSALLLVMVEGAGAMQSYSTMLEASREGARMVLREGETAPVEDLVAALTQNLAQEGVTTTVTMDPAAKTVTVEVGYVYQTLFSESSFLETIGADEPLLLFASTTMPLP